MDRESAMSHAYGDKCGWETPRVLIATSMARVDTPFAVSRSNWRQ